MRVSGSSSRIFPSILDGQLLPAFTPGFPGLSLTARLFCLKIAQSKNLKPFLEQFCQQMESKSSKQKSHFHSKMVALTFLALLPLAKGSKVILISAQSKRQDRKGNSRPCSVMCANTVVRTHPLWTDMGSLPSSFST